MIPFNKPYMAGSELDYIAEAHRNSMLAGDGAFTKRCHAWLEDLTGTSKALLTHSCTAALEMSAILLDIIPGDEIILPSFTFVSTANAFVLRGAVPVFVDVRPDTLNIDETKIEAAVSARTKAIAVVHYGGVSCEMDGIKAIAKEYGLAIIEDAAQGIMSYYKGQALGSMGDFGCYSFHETKNIISGEGGALLVNRQDLVESAEIIREKGTDRSKFFRGEVDKYTWQRAGSSFLPGELIAAFLYAQLQDAQAITARRLALWRTYHSLLLELEQRGLIRRPTIPEGCEHNGHLYFVLLREDINRERVLSTLREEGVGAVFHYVPLHSSPAGRKFGRMSGELPYTSTLSEQLIRLPMWIGLSEDQQDRVVDVLSKALSE